MIHVFYSHVGAESGLALTKAIHGLGAKVEAHPQKYGDFKKAADDLCVSWGASRSKKFGNRARWLNKNVWFDKLDHIKRMTEFGVPTVEVAYDNKAPGKWLARTIAHWDGDDLEQNLKQGDYFVKFVETTKEFRAHIFRGEVLRFSLKVPSPKFLEPGEKINEKYRIGNGWVFSDHNYKNDVGPKMRKAAVDAVAALGYDFGGIDLAYKKDGGVVVFEVNSAPWLGGEMQREYAKRIIALV